MKYKKIISLLFVFVFLLPIFYLGIEKETKTNYDDYEPLIKGVIDLEVKDKNGNIKYKTEFPMHSATDNFGRFILAIFSPYASGFRLGGFKSDGGCNMEVSVSKDTVDTFTRTCGSGKLYISFGSSSNPVFNREKYELSSKVADVVVDNTGKLYVGDDMIISISGAYTANQDVNITEIGLKLRARSYGYCPDRGWHDVPYLIFYDVLPSPVELKSGETLTVTYKIIFP